MKKIILGVFMAICAFNGFAKKSDKSYRATIQEKFEYNKTNAQLGYQLIEGGEKIVFVFSPSLYEIKAPKKVFVQGSFNGWSKGKNIDWMLEKNKNYWSLTCPIADVKVPGNSGFPEFKFYVKADVEYEVRIVEATSIRTKEEVFEPNAKSKIPGFQMATNNLILFPEDDPQVVVENTKIANRLRKLKEYDLSNVDDIARLTNIRLVPGTTKLYRGYHPYKKSRSFDTEKTRLEYVNKLIEANGVKSIITLCGNEKISKDEEISNYIQFINYSQNHFFTDTSYNTVYYNSNGKEFGKLIGEIVHFIGEHPGPYYVHCRLGTDRTGTVSAILAALCGASWQEITTDYQKTNEMEIKEFRDYRLLQYSFEKMLDCPISEIENLQTAVSNYFLDKKFFTKPELQACIENLKS